METGRRKTRQFQHDKVTTSFRYDSSRLKTVKDCRTANVMAEERTEGWFAGQGTPDLKSIAAIGPWSTWTFEVRESENDKLDMKGLTAGWIEVGGSYCAFEEA